MSSTNWNPKPNTVPEYEVQDVTGFVDLFGELEGHRGYMGLFRGS